MSLTLSLLWLWSWCERYSEECYFCEFFSIFEPISICWCSISTSWICFCFCIFEKMTCFWKGFKKKSTITSKCKHTISRIYAIFSKHSFCMKIRNIWEELEEIVESGFRGGHGYLVILIWIIHTIICINQSQTAIYIASLACDDASLEFSIAFWSSR